MDDWAYHSNSAVRLAADLAQVEGLVTEFGQLFLLHEAKSLKKLHGEEKVTVEAQKFVAAIKAPLQQLDNQAEDVLSMKRTYDERKASRDAPPSVPTPEKKRKK